MQVTNKLQITNNQNKVFDLEDRTLKFSRSLFGFIKVLPKDQYVEIPIKQLIRSSTAIGANYLEANDSLGKKDFILRVRIARKEAKETLYWLSILLDLFPSRNVEINNFIKEALALRNILSKIIINSISNV